jgi:outer membrane protein assembly factor BamE (lipoprotein component of BamABCDE complex)
MSIAKILSLGGTGICCLALFIFGQLMLDEGYNPVVPDIDTKYAPNFSVEKFNMITVGMDTNDVIKLIGQPIGKQGKLTQKWYYTADGKCKWGDFAWLNSNLVIDRDGKVKLIFNQIKSFY